MKWFRNYKYKGLTLLAINIILTIFLSKFDFLNKFFFNTIYIPFAGSFIAGMLYVSTSTAVLGILILTNLAKTLPPLEIAVLAGVGGAVADFGIFRFFRDSLLGELTPIYNKLGGRHLTRLMYHRSFRWSLPIIGAIIIASPLPDEIGISLMGISKIKGYQFFLLSLVLDIGGLFVFVSALSLIK